MAECLLPTDRCDELFEQGARMRPDDVDLARLPVRGIDVEHGARIDVFQYQGARWLVGPVYVRFVDSDPVVYDSHAGRNVDHPRPVFFNFDRFPGRLARRIATRALRLHQECRGARAIQIPRSGRAAGCRRTADTMFCTGRPVRCQTSWAGVHPNARHLKADHANPTIIRVVFEHVADLDRVVEVRARGPARIGWVNAQLDASEGGIAEVADRAGRVAGGLEECVAAGGGCGAGDVERVVAEGRDQEVGRDHDRAEFRLLFRSRSPSRSSLRQVEGDQV